MEKYRLWDGSVPGGEAEDGAPYLTYYRAAKKKTDAAVLILPGGGYTHRAAHEGKGYAEFLNSLGMDAFVLDYRVAPYRHPYPLLDARRAMRIIRKNAEKCGINTKRVAVMGSSAGGHLAAMLSTYKDMLLGEGCDEIDNIDAMPNMQILCYPVIDILGHHGSFENLLGENIERHAEFTPTNHISENAPPAFIWHTSTDETVDINNTFRYAEALHRAGVQMEMHVYPTGVHGAGLAKVNENPDRVVPYLQRWPEELERYFKFSGWL